MYDAHKTNHPLDPCLYLSLAFAAIRGRLHGDSVHQRVGDALRILMARPPLGIRLLDSDRGLPGTHSHPVQGRGLLFTLLTVITSSTVITDKPISCEDAQVQICNIAYFRGKC